MAETKWTPGPWSYELVGDDDPKRSFYSIDRPGLGKVGSSELGESNHATAQFEFVDIAQAEANARLIAAAPELYDACEAFCELFRNCDMRPEDESWDVFGKIKSAMDKARGEAS